MKKYFVILAEVRNQDFHFRCEFLLLCNYTYNVTNV